MESVTHGSASILILPPSPTTKKNITWAQFQCIAQFQQPKSNSSGEAQQLSQSQVAQLSQIKFVKLNFSGDNHPQILSIIFGKTKKNLLSSVRQGIELPVIEILYLGGTNLYGNSYMLYMLVYQRVLGHLCVLLVEVAGRERGCVNLLQFFLSSALFI